MAGRRARLQQASPQAEPAATTLRWPATGAGPNGALFKFTVLDGVAHEYPNGANNPHGFTAAQEFWRFFSEHRLP